MFTSFIKKLKALQKKNYEIIGARDPRPPAPTALLIILFFS